MKRRRICDIITAISTLGLIHVASVFTLSKISFWGALTQIILLSVVALNSAVVGGEAE